MTIVPWKDGKSLVWDATCPDTLAPSYTAMATNEAGAVADLVEKKKRRIYTDLEPTHHFVPIGIETLGVFRPEAKSFFVDLGHRLRETNSDSLSYTQLIQRISVAVQRGNAASTLAASGSEA